MYKVGVCGHFAEGQNLLNGQTVKTKILADELIKKLGLNEVMTIDTYGWKRRPLKLLFDCFMLIKNCRNVIILPANNGVKVFVPMFLFMNSLFHRKLYYIVIGGWLPELSINNKGLRKKLAKLDGIYVETCTMINALNKLGMDNVYYLPNFKRLKILNEDDLVYAEGEPYKLCTFMRVMKEKGIEDAIEAVKVANRECGRVVYTLDIYGQIDLQYKDRFEQLQKEFPEYIRYCGCVTFDKSVEVLKDYFALLFPTYYEGEGFAGTILDAFASGIPIIATDWMYNSEIIEDYKTGILYNYKTPEKLSKILFQLSSNSNTISLMKKECIKKAHDYSAEVILSKLTDYLV